MKRYFALLLVLACAPAFAAGSGETALRDKLAGHWKTSKEYTLAIAEQMPAESYSFKPNADQMTFGEQMAHIAGANMYFMSIVTGEKPGEEPKDSINLKIAESFIPTAKFEIPATKEAWQKQRDQMMAGLKEKVFAGWPKETVDLDVKEIAKSEKSGWRMRELEFTSESTVRARIYLVESLAGAKPQRINLYVLGENEWEGFVANMGGLFPDVLGGQTRQQERGDGPVSGAYLAVRGVGPGAWNVDEKKRTQILRRYWLLGQTVDGMRVWDVRRAIAAIRSIDPSREIRITGSGYMSVVGLYASLFEPNISEVALQHPPMTHQNGPQLLNVLKVMDIPQAAALAADKCKVSIVSGDAEAWKYPKEVAEKMGWQTFDLTSQK